MPKKKKNKHPQDKLTKYIGDNILNGDICIVSAAINLVESGEIYKRDHNADGLLRVASAWYDLGRMLLGIDDQDEQTRPFGFGIVDGGMANGANKD